MQRTGRSENPWPSLPYEEWRDTCETLHLWTQVVGKLAIALAPWVNHSWHVTLRVTARGLTTRMLPYGTRMLQIGFDFIEHRLLLQLSDGAFRTLALRPMTVADFYREVREGLASLGVTVAICTTPSELEQAVPFEEDCLHRAYDPEQAHRFWSILVQTQRVLDEFRALFVGKCSPVHFFWGGFDLAVTRFSGRTAPPHPGGVPHLPDWVAREAYSREVSSAGFWPGGAAAPYPLFYSYAYPEPEGYRTAAVRPDLATYHPGLREWVLPYDAVREARVPDEVLRTFLQSTYEAAAELGRWDRALLEWQGHRPGEPR